MRDRKGQWQNQLIFIASKRLFSTCSFPSSVQLENSIILTSATVRNLGVTLDQTLSFQSQISSVCRACFLELRRIASVRNLLSDAATTTLISAFVLSRLDYCNSLLSGCLKKLLIKLQKVQNNAARLVLRRSISSHATPMLESLHWLPVEKRIDYKLSLLCYKSLNDLAPSYLASLLKVYIPPRQLRSSSDSLIFQIPHYYYKTLGERSFSFQALTSWNKLPLSLRNSDSLSSLKSSLKTSLFKL